jgi:cyclophilin family peptidyl-prolyl cis-trans isomerase
MRPIALLAAAMLLWMAAPAFAQDSNATQAPPPGQSTAPADAAAPAAAPPPPAPAMQQPTNPSMTGPQMLISTSMGDITVQLDQVRAPKSVASVVRYVHDRHYNGTVVYRAVKGFLIQMGSWDANVKGRPGHAPSPLEANNGLSNLRGSVALARAAEPDSASADFFINTADNTALDHKPDDSGNATGYTVFGQVIAGMNVVDRISEVAVGDHGPMAGQAPVEPVTITKVSIVGEPDVAPKAAKAPATKKK